MDTTIGTEVLPSTGWLWKGKALASDDGRAIPRGIADAVRLPVNASVSSDSGDVQAREGVRIVPIVGEQGDRVRGDRTGDARIVPTTIRGIGVVIALNVDGVFRGNGQTAEKRRKDKCRRGSSLCHARL